MVTSVTSSASAVGVSVTPYIPKHAHLPDIGLDNNVLFEAMVFIFSAMVLGLQYINLYKTVWWLPHSSANYALVCLHCVN
jgi:hypothetical protein